MAIGPARSGLRGVTRMRGAGMGVVTGCPGRSVWVDSVGGSSR